MTGRLRRLLGGHEVVLIVVTLLLSIAIGAVNPAFYSLQNAFDLLKTSVPLGILTIGLLVVLISGGIDISFPAIAVAGMYITCTLAKDVRALDHLPALLAISTAIGLVLGLFNGVLIHFFRLPALIVTLGTASLIRGALLEFIGTRTITNLPSSIIAFSRANLFEAPLASGASAALTVSILFLAGVAVAVAFVLRYTVMGRGAYAVGADLAAAERVGFNVRRIHLFVYGLMGALAGLVGIIHASIIRNANPLDLDGLELTVIAAAVIGGASITGGRGTVTGALVGVALMVIMDGSLVLVGLPSQWHQVFIGLVVLVSTSITALRTRSPRAGEIAR
jgi:simple sugar transport system permease protein